MNIRFCGSYTSKGNHGGFVYGNNYYHICIQGHQGNNLQTCDVCVCPQASGPDFIGCQGRELKDFTKLPDRYSDRVKKLVIKAVKEDIFADPFASYEPSKMECSSPIGYIVGQVNPEEEMI